MHRDSTVVVLFFSLVIVLILLVFVVSQYTYDTRQWNSERGRLKQTIKDQWTTIEQIHRAYSNGR